MGKFAQSQDHAQHVPAPTMSSIALTMVQLGWASPFKEHQVLSFKIFFCKFCCHLKLSKMEKIHKCF
jgi:hypothetical protein